MSVPPKKKRFYAKDDFSDKQVYNEIKDEIKTIRDRNLKQVEEDSLINNLYETKKKEMKIKRIRSNEESKPKAVKQSNMHQLGQEDQEQGQIKKTFPQQEQKENQKQTQKAAAKLSVKIKEIIVPRKKILQFYRSRKFEQMIVGCFVRYLQHPQSYANKSNQSYVIGYVIGTFKTDKQYQFQNIPVTVGIRIQQVEANMNSSPQGVKLRLDSVSNTPSNGSLQIYRWINANSKHLPSEEALAQKHNQLQRFKNIRTSAEQIDSNLFQKAKHIAQDKAHHQSEQILNSIYFMNSHIHDLRVKISQMQANRNKSNQYAAKVSQKQQSEQILAKLQLKKKNNQLKQDAERKQKQKLKEKQGKEKIQSQMHRYENRDDQIQPIYNKFLFKISSQDGIKQVREQLHKAHMKFNINVDI